MYLLVRGSEMKLVMAKEGIESISLRGKIILGTGTSF
jgi:hypothetical protein